MSNRPKNVASSPNVKLSNADIYYQNIIKLAKRKTSMMWGYNSRRVGSKRFKQLLLLLKTK